MPLLPDVVGPPAVVVGGLAVAVVAVGGADVVAGALAEVVVGFGVVGAVGLMAGVVGGLAVVGAVGVDPRGFVTAGPLVPDGTDVAPDGFGPDGAGVEGFVDEPDDAGAVVALAPRVARTVGLVAPPLRPFAPGVPLVALGGVPPELSADAAGVAAGSPDPSAVEAAGPSLVAPAASLGEPAPLPSPVSGPPAGFATVVACHADGTCEVPRCGNIESRTTRAPATQAPMASVQLSGASHVRTCRRRVGGRLGPSSTARIGTLSSPEDGCPNTSGNCARGSLVARRARLSRAPMPSVGGGSALLGRGGVRGASAGASVLLTP